MTARHRAKPLPVLKKPTISVGPALVPAPEQDRGPSAGSRIARAGAVRPELHRVVVHGGTLREALTSGLRRVRVRGGTPPKE